MIFRTLLIVFLFGFSSIYCQEEKPNFLLIQVDDMGYDDLSINGNTVSRTPNLDQLANESVRFGNFMLHSVCAPTRASLMTGRDFWRTGVYGVHGGADFMNLNEVTIAEMILGDTMLDCSC